MPDAIAIELGKPDRKIAFDPDATAWTMLYTVEPWPPDRGYQLDPGYSVFVHRIGATPAAQYIAHTWRRDVGPLWVTDYISISRDRAWAICDEMKVERPMPPGDPEVEFVHKLRRDKKRTQAKFAEYMIGLKRCLVDDIGKYVQESNDADPNTLATTMSRTNASLVDLGSDIEFTISDEWVYKVGSSGRGAGKVV